MTEEDLVKIEKAHDVSKTDPDYKIKVNEVLTRRFEEEKRKSVEREKAKMDAGRKKEPAEKSNPIPETDNIANNVDKNKPAEIRDPEEFVKRKDIAALVGQLNNSFAIIEKFRLKTEKILSKLEKAFKEEE